MKWRQLSEDLRNIKYLLSALVILTLHLHCFGAGELSFPDSKGTVIRNEKDYIIRLIDSHNSSIKTAEAVFIVNAKPDKCFDIISDISEYYEFMPNITKSSFVSKNSDSLIYEMVFEVAFIDIEYTISVKNESKLNFYSSLWNYVKGDLKETKGSWSIEPYKNNSNWSIIRYEVYLDTGSFMPGWLQNKLTAGSIPDMIYAIKKRAEKK